MRRCGTCWRWRRHNQSNTRAKTLATQPAALVEEPAHRITSIKPAHRRRDIAPELGSLEETNAALRDVVALAEELQAASGKRVLWGTAQLFKHPRYAHGAATSARPVLRRYRPGRLPEPA